MSAPGPGEFFLFWIFVTFIIAVLALVVVGVAFTVMTLVAAVIAYGPAAWAASLGGLFCTSFVIAALAASQ